MSSSSSEARPPPEEGVEVARTPFPFPYGRPYDVQAQFMERLFEVADRGQGRVGIFESPTGTGKSLSIIVSSLHWLLEHLPRKEVAAAELRAAREAEAGAAGEPDWVASFFADKDRAAVGERHAREERVRQGLKRERAKEEAEEAGAEEKVAEAEEADELMVDWDENQPPREQQRREEEERGRRRRRRWPGAGEGDDEEAPPTTPKIIYCSRTHSQLSQFVNEIKKTSFAGTVRCVSLGGRKNLCVHPEVSKIEGAARMNDACLDMVDARRKAGKSKEKKKKQKKKAAAAAGCPYLEDASQKTFSSRALARLRDLEELRALGERLDACAYYGTRKAVAEAHVVTMPYAALLHAPTRESLGVSLRGCVVVVDEAHNLIETINQVHSARLTVPVMRAAHSQLSQYLERYRDRLRDSNRQMIERILRTVRNFLDVLAPGRGAQRSVLRMNAFLFEARQDNVNPFPMRRFIEESGLVKKLNGFNELAGAVGEDEERQEDGDEYRSRHVSALGQVNEFLGAICNSNTDGRILLDRGEGGPAGRQTARRTASLQFLMMNPAVHFEPVVREARAVVLAGGTMQPFGLFVEQLFGGLPRDLLHTFSCGHVVPPESVLAVSVPCGPSGVPYDFTFRTRDRPETLDELGMGLLNLCRVVPEGVVVFFPSYAYEQAAMERWARPRAGGRPALLAEISARKRVFREARGGGAAAMDRTLREYTRTIEEEGRGALISCVVGGKMSEGINFSDGLARCVAMVGMPYANRRDPELAEKMEYLDKNLPHAAGQPPPSEQHYQNMCMRAVNQSIGRAIRNIGDYATIVLLDKRYATERVASQLPGWIAERTVHAPSFGAAHGHVARFFSARRKAAAAAAAAAAGT